MGRHGYTDDYGDDGPLALGRYRAAVTSAFRGRRGQRFLRELIEALDALPEKKLITGELERDGCVCAFGAVGRKIGLDMSKMTMRDEDSYDDPPPDDFEIIDALDLAVMFDVATSMAREIMYENDEGGRHDETPERRWARIREWARHHLIEWDDEAAK